MLDPRIAGRVQGRTESRPPCGVRGTRGRGRGDGYGGGGSVIDGRCVTQHSLALPFKETSCSVHADCLLFNSGKGAVFNVAGKVSRVIFPHYMRHSNPSRTSSRRHSYPRPPSTNPSIPHTRRGVRITLLTHMHNPSKLARALYLALDAAPHTMFSGTAAESFGAPFGIELVDESYFFTGHCWREHRRGLGLPEEPLPYPGNGQQQVPLDQLPAGTVGAVALDVRGCIASVTSTGGRTNKLVARVRDAPGIGSGFWAEEWTVRSWLRRVWRLIHGKGKKVAVGMSETGDGDVSASIILRFCCGAERPWFSVFRTTRDDIDRPAEDEVLARVCP